MVTLNEAKNAALALTGAGMEISEISELQMGGKCHHIRNQHHRYKADPQFYLPPVP